MLVVAQYPHFSYKVRKLFDAGQPSPHCYHTATEGATADFRQANVGSCKPATAKQLGSAVCQRPRGVAFCAKSSRQSQLEVGRTHWLGFLLIMGTRVGGTIVANMFSRDFYWLCLQHTGVAFQRCCWAGIHQLSLTTKSPPMSLLFYKGLVES